MEVGPRGRHRRAHPGRRLKGADVFFGLSVKGALTPEMVDADGAAADHLRHGQSRSGDHAGRGAAVRPDAIIATGRSDYPNQVNNVLGFPYIFRGALDVRARRVNMEMKIACANALAQLAREDVPDEVAAAYHGGHAEVRARLHHPLAVRSAADLVHPAVRRPGGDGHRRRAPADRGHGRLSRRRWPSGSIPPPASCRRSPARCSRRRKKRIVFAEGEEPQVIRAAYAFQSQGLGQAMLVGREELVRREHARRRPRPGRGQAGDLNARLSRAQSPSSSTSSTRGCSATGYLRRDVLRLINQDRNSFAACYGRAAATPTAWSPASPAAFDQALEEVLRVIDPAPGGRVIGMSIVLAKGRTLFIADTNVTEMPEADELVEIAVEAADGRAPAGLHPARRLHVLFRLRQSDGRALGEGARGRGHARRARRRRLRIRGRDAAGAGARSGAARQLSVHAPDRPGQCADHAGDPLGLDLDQAGAGAGRGDGGRPDPARPVQVGADLPAVGLGLEDPQHGDDGRLRATGERDGLAGAPGASPSTTSWSPSPSGGGDEVRAFLLLTRRRRADRGAVEGDAPPRRRLDEAHYREYRHCGL